MEMNEKSERRTAMPGGKVAIIGMAGRFPGSKDIDEFWNHLRDGDNLVRKIGRFQVPGDPEISQYAGLVSDIYGFDPDFFGYSKEAARTTDPQHRIMMEICQELLDRAGYAAKELGGTEMPVIIGAGNSRFDRHHRGPIGRFSAVSSLQSMLAGRLANFYDLRGKAMVIDTACASSLTAIHEACEWIGSNSGGMAIAGGISLFMDDYYIRAFSAQGALSMEGCSLVFDERARGFILGEGAGLLLLKDYDQAIADGDIILGVIIGSAINNNGHTMGLTVPNCCAQEEVIRSAL